MKTPSQENAALHLGGGGVREGSAGEYKAAAELLHRQEELTLAGLKTLH